MLKWRTSLDVDPNRCEILGGHSNNRHIADDDGLNPRFLLRALSVAQLSPHIGKDLAKSVRRLRGILQHVTGDLRVFFGIVKPTNVELERPADAGQILNSSWQCLGARVANFRLQAL